MMGLYPDCPGEPFYTLTTPVFDKVTIHTANGDITIERKDSDSNSPYIKEIVVGEKKTENHRISHRELLEKKKIVLTLGKEIK